MPKDKGSGRAKKAYATDSASDSDGPRVHGRPNRRQDVEDEYSETKSFTFFMPTKMVEAVDRYAEYATRNERFHRVSRAEAIRNLVQYSLRQYRKRKSGVTTTTEEFGPAAFLEDTNDGK